MLLLLILFPIAFDGAKDGIREKYSVKNKMVNECKYCGRKNLPKFQMKTSDICNICAYYRNAKKDLEKTYKKFKNAKTFRT